MAFDTSGLFLAVGGADARVYGAKQDWDVVKTFPDQPKKVCSRPSLLCAVAETTRSQKCTSTNAGCTVRSVMSVSHAVLLYYMSLCMATIFLLNVIKSRLN